MGMLYADTDQATTTMNPIPIRVLNKPVTGFEYPAGTRGRGDEAVAFFFIPVRYLSLGTHGCFDPPVIVSVLSISDGIVIVGLALIISTG